jgi:hypothetical protein
VDDAAPMPHAAPQQRAETSPLAKLTADQVRWRMTPRGLRLVPGPKPGSRRRPKQPPPDPIPVDAAAPARDAAGEAARHPVDAAALAAIAEVISRGAPEPALAPRLPPYGLRFGLDDPLPQGDPNSPASVMWALAARSARMGRGSLR